MTPNQHDDQAPPPPRAGRGWIFYFFACAAALVGWLYWNTPAALLEAAEEIEIAFLLPVLLLHPAATIIMGLRLHTALLPFGARDVPRSVALLFVCGPLGYFLSAYALPLVLLLFRNVAKIALLPLLVSFALLRLLDLLLTLAVLALFPLPVQSLPPAAQLSVQKILHLASLLGVSALAFVLFTPWLHRRAERAGTAPASAWARFVQEGIRRVLESTAPYAVRPALQLRLLGWSLLLFALQAFSMLVALRFALHLPVPLQDVLVMAALQRLVSLIPAPPAEIGLQEISATAIFTALFDIPAAPIGAVTLLMHGGTVLVFILMGIGGAFYLRLSPRDLKLQPPDA